MSRECVVEDEREEEIGGQEGYGADEDGGFLLEGGEV